VAPAKLIASGALQIVSIGCLLDWKIGLTGVEGYPRLTVWDLWASLILALN
jgi:hypothetical protein